MRGFLLLFACCFVATQRPASAEDSAADALGVMYWTDRTAGLYRAARDGSEIKLIVPGTFINSIAVDRDVLGGKGESQPGEPGRQRHRGARQRKIGALQLAGDLAAGRLARRTPVPGEIAGTVDNLHNLDAIVNRDVVHHIAPNGKAAQAFVEFRPRNSELRPACVDGRCFVDRFDQSVCTHHVLAFL